MWCFSGTTKIENLEANAASLGVKLNAEDLKEIGETIPVDQVGGEREYVIFSKYMYKLANTPPSKIWYCPSSSPTNKILGTAINMKRLKIPTFSFSFMEVCSFETFVLDFFCFRYIYNVIKCPLLSDNRNVLNIVWIKVVLFPTISCLCDHGIVVAFYNEELKRWSLKFMIISHLEWRWLKKTSIFC